jgi:hypothetical protein
MTVFNKAMIILAAGASVSACGIRDAHIAIPHHLTVGTEKIELRGMGGGRKGDFRLAAMRGSFTRSADRLAVFDPLLVRNSGGGSFKLDPNGELGNLSGRCRYRQGEINAGSLSVTPKRLAYECRFERDGRPIAAEFVMKDPKSAFGTLHGRADREGTLYYEGQEIEVKSVHKDQGGGLATPYALGYMFEMDGVEIGAVDLNGLNKTIYAPRSGKLREAVLAGSLALSIFWDPESI